MARAPRVSGPEVLRALQRAGWMVSRQSGSHAILHHQERPGRVVVPLHAGRIIKPKTLASIVRSAGMTSEEFRALL